MSVPEGSGLKPVAERLAHAISRNANPELVESVFRLRIQPSLEEAVRELGLELDAKDEYRLFEGRADTVYNRLVIEYKRPETLHSRNNTTANGKAIEQVKAYITGLHRRERHQMERYAGAVTDGRFYIFLRFKHERWRVDPPVPVDALSTERFLGYLIALSTELAATPENLLRDFGENTPCSRRCVGAFYRALAASEVPKVNTLYRQWAFTFSEICGYEENSPKLDVADLARGHGVRPASGERKVNPFKLFFAIHSYYATFIKLLAVQIVNFYAREKIARIATHEPVSLEQAASLDSKGLNWYLEAMEEGGVFRHVGVRNFLEGDFFRWYLDTWDDTIDEALRQIIHQLAGYSFVTLDTDPDGTRDLLKKLYQNLMPPRLRHDLGEYYTPDWLAEQVLNQLHGGSPDRIPRSPDERLLDPACGSGTFLVLHIKAIRQHARDVLLPTRKLTPRQLLEKIVTNVVGYDLNPLAVISARTNYLLALGDLLDQIHGEIDIPIYLADSVAPPAPSTQLGAAGTVPFPTAVGQFAIPYSLLKANYIDELANLLEESVCTKLEPEAFRRRLCASVPLDPAKDARDIALLDALYEQLRDLDRQRINGIWARIIKNAFAPVFQPGFDCIAGNPPWINWENLPDEYRNRTAWLWHRYHLFAEKESKARLASDRSKADISALMFYVAMDRYLKRGGRLGFVITQTVFKTEAGTRGFRRFELPERRPIRVAYVDDMSALQPFEGATNRTAVVIAERDRQTKYPVAYGYWRKKTRGSSLAIDSELTEVSSLTTRSQWVAQPVSATDPLSPWITGRQKAVNRIARVIGPSPYHSDAREGSNTRGANGIYWVQQVGVRNDGCLLVANEVDSGRRREVQSVQVAVEPDHVFPLLRGKDVGRWSANPVLSILLPYDSGSASCPIPQSELPPKTLAFFRHFERELSGRSSFRNFDPGSGCFYEMYNVGPYTFAPSKVVWREQASFLTCAVVGRADGGKPIVPDHKLMICPCGNEEEGHYVCALLNCSIAQFIVKSYALETSVSTHVLNYVCIPKFDAANRLHRLLAQSGAACHAAKAASDDGKLTHLEARNDELAAELWGLSAPELKDIKDSLADLGG